MKVLDYCVICGSEHVEIMPGMLAPFIAHRIFHWRPVMMINNDGTQIMSWPICGSIKCLDCSFVCCDMRFDDDEMMRLYRNYRDEAYISLRETYEPGYRKLNEELEGKIVNYFDKIEAFILKSAPAKPRRVLDWGGNNGVNTPFKDAEIDIYDIADKPPMFGKLVVQPEPPYDLIVCSNVLEHVSYPGRVLNEIRAYMDKDSVLYIEVPKENREYLTWHEHINRFSDLSMKTLVDRCGLQILDFELIPPPKHGYEALILVMAKRKA